MHLNGLGLELSLGFLLGQKETDNDSSLGGERDPCELEDRERGGIYLKIESCALREKAYYWLTQYQAREHLTKPSTSLGRHPLIQCWNGGAGEEVFRAGRCGAGFRWVLVPSVGSPRLPSCPLRVKDCRGASVPHNASPEPRQSVGWAAGPH